MFMIQAQVGSESWENTSLKEMKNLLLKEGQSFKAAAKGVYFFFKQERHALIHLVAAIFALFLSWCLSISILEWTVIIFCIILVLVAEILNTCIEQICDLVTKERNIHIARIKDMAAGGVLLVALASLAIACLIFLPKILASVSGQ